MLSYERTPQIERKAGQIESRCCELSYEADKLNSGKDIIKEKPCICSLLSMILMMHTSCLLSIEGATDSTCDESVRVRRIDESRHRKHQVDYRDKSINTNNDHSITAPITEIMDHSIGRMDAF